MKPKIIIIGVVVLIALGALYAFRDSAVLGGAGGVGARECTVTESLATVGNNISSTVLAEYTNRAWAVIQLPLLATGVATNTVSLSFDEGAAAVSGTDFTLSTSTPITEPFGLNSDFSYTGAVTGITSTGSTTLRVVECRY